MKYVYFISFVYTREDGYLVHGNCEVARPSQITDKTELDLIANKLKESGYCTEIPIIITFILLRTEEDQPAETK